MPVPPRWDGVLAFCRTQSCFLVLKRCSRGGVEPDIFAFSEAFLVTRSSTLGLEPVPVASDSVRATLSGSPGGISSGHSVPRPSLLSVARPGISAAATGGTRIGWFTAGGVGGVVATLCHAVGLDISPDVVGASFGVGGVRESADLVELCLDGDSAAKDDVEPQADLAECSLDEASPALGESANPAGSVFDVNLDCFCPTPAPEVVLVRCGTASADGAVSREGGVSFLFETLTVRRSWEAFLARVGELSRRDTGRRSTECWGGEGLWEEALLWRENRGVDASSTEVDVLPAVSLDIIDMLPGRKVCCTAEGEADSPRRMQPGFIGGDKVGAAEDDAAASLLMAKRTRSKSGRRCGSWRQQLSISFLWLVGATERQGD